MMGAGHAGFVAKAGVEALSEGSTTSIEVIARPEFHA